MEWRETLNEKYKFSEKAGLIMALTQERIIQKILTEDYRCPAPTLQISLLWKESEQRDS